MASDQRSEVCGPLRSQPQGQRSTLALTEQPDRCLCGIGLGAHPGHALHHPLGKQAHVSPLAAPWTLARREQGQPQPGQIPLAQSAHHRDATGPQALAGLDDKHHPGGPGRPGPARTQGLGSHLDDVLAG